MKKNDMLNESTIRRFMKLATIDGLSDKFVADKLEESTEEVEEGMRAKRDEDEMREGEEELEEMRDKRDDDEMDEMRDKRDDDEMDEMRDKRDEDEMDEMRDKRDEDIDEAKHDDDLEEGKHEDDEMREASIEEEEMDMDKPAEAGGMVSVDQLMKALEKALEDVLGQEVEVSQDDDEMEMDMGMDMDADDADMDMDSEEEDLEEVNDDVIEEVFARVIQRLTKETKSNKE